MQGRGKGLGWRCSRESGPPRPERGGAGAVMSEAEAGRWIRKQGRGRPAWEGLPQRPSPSLHHPGGTHIRHCWGGGGSGAAGLPLGEGPGEGLASSGAGGTPGSGSGVTNPVTLGSLPRTRTRAAEPVGLTLGLPPPSSQCASRVPRPPAHFNSQGHRTTQRGDGSLSVPLASKNTSSSARGAGHSRLRTAGASPAGSVGH